MESPREVRATMQAIATSPAATPYSVADGGPTVVRAGASRRMVPPSKATSLKNGTEAESHEESVPRPRPQTLGTAQSGGPHGTPQSRQSARSGRPLTEQASAAIVRSEPRHSSTKLPGVTSPSGDASCRSRVHSATLPSQEITGIVAGSAQDPGPVGRTTGPFPSDSLTCVNASHASALRW